MPCRFNRRREVSTRILAEAYAHRASNWATATYEEGHLPVDENRIPILVKKDYQDWFKRIRKAGVPFRYACVGEYGDEFQRPHFHVAFYGIAPEEEKFLEETWTHGFVRCYNLDKGLAQYMAGYSVKKMTQESDDRLYGRPPEFARWSKGLGKDFAQGLASKRYVELNGDVASQFRQKGKLLPLDRTMRLWQRQALGLENPHLSRNSPEEPQRHELVISAERARIATMRARRRRGL